MASFWVQHGYGKSHKIEQLAADSLLGGVILSPADEEPSAMRETVTSLDSVPCLLDPQTYVYSIPGGAARCHEAHGLKVTNLNWGMPAAEVEAAVSDVVAANDHLGIEDIVAPTCLQRNFADVWTSLSLQMARTTLSVAGGGRRVYVSVVIDEGALDSWQDVENWLNVVTQMDAHGFYLVVARSAQASYPAPWIAARLVNWLRLVYSLASLNGYEVVVGYGDVEGASAVAVGATGSASGWYYSLRAFSESKWQPSSGGRQANPRVYGSGLLTPILAIGEAENVAGTTLGAEIFPDTSLRHRIESDPEGWSLPDSWMQHLRGVAALVNELGGIEATAERLNALEGYVDASQARLSALETQGIPVSGSYGARLVALRDGIAGFRAAETV